MKTLPMSKITMFAFVVLIITVIDAPDPLLRGQGAAQGDSVAQLVRHDPSRELAMKDHPAVHFRCGGRHHHPATGRRGGCRLSSSRERRPTTWSNMFSSPRWKL